MADIINESDYGILKTAPGSPEDRSHQEPFMIIVGLHIDTICTAVCQNRCDSYTACYTHIRNTLSPLDLWTELAG